MTLLRKKNEGIKTKMFIYIFKNQDNTFFKRKIILKNDCHFSYVFKEEYWHTALVQPLRCTTCDCALYIEQILVTNKYVFPTELLMTEWKAV